MIQPEAYYAAHKEAPDPMTLGRIGFAMVGREDELVPPLTASERWMLSTILRCNKWHNENRDAIKDKWRKDKQRQRSKDAQVSTDVHQCPQDNDGQEMSTTSPSLPPSLSHSLSPSLTQTDTTRTDTESVRLAKAASGTGRVKINPYEMDGAEFFGGKWSTLQLCNAALGGGFWAKAIRQLGDAKVLEELWRFICEVKAGEAVDNPGAAMTKRLKEMGVK